MAKKPNTDLAVIDVGPSVVRATGGGLEGAERTSRETFAWNPVVMHPDQQINPRKEMADARSRDSVQNDGYAMGAINTYKDSIVGSQYMLNATPNIDILGAGATDAWAEEFQRTVEARFNLLADSEECYFDASRKNTFTGLVRLAVGGFGLTGEVLGTAEWMRDSMRPFRTAIQMVSPSRLCNPSDKMDDKFLRRGIHQDMYGRPLGYWFRSTHPGSFEFDPMQSFNWSYVPAVKPWGRKQVIHIIEQLQVEQSRGVADMVTVLKNMRMTKQFREVTLQNAVVNATYAAAVESDLPSDVVFQSMGAGQAGLGGVLKDYLTALTAYTGSSNHIAIDGVKMPHLFPGTKLNLKPMGTPGGVGTGFEESLLRHTAAGLGLSYEQFSRDYTKTNYSSARASMTETWKFMQGRKKSVADRFAKAIYVLWLEEEINAGNVPMPKGMGPEAFYDPVLREALTSCDWIGASRGQIDELKETQAAAMRVNTGFSTHEIECAKLGLDWRRIFRQRAREQRMMEELGLSFDMAATKPGTNKTKQLMEDNTEKEEE